MISRIPGLLILAIAAVLVVPGCNILEGKGPGNDTAGRQSITVYDMEPIRGDDGEILRGADGAPLVRMTNPRETSERAFVLTLQQKAIAKCGEILQSEQDANSAEDLVDSAAGDSGYWDWKKQRDLIIALKPEFDPTGCTALVRAQSEYWRTIQTELSLIAQQGAQRARLLNTVMKLAGFYLITDSIGDTLVGVAQASGGVNIGNRIAGNVKPGAAGDAVGPASSSASGDSEFSGDFIITTGPRSGVQTGDGQYLTDDAGVNEGDGILGQLITRPINAPQPEAPIDVNSGGASGAF